MFGSSLSPTKDTERSHSTPNTPVSPSKATSPSRGEGDTSPGLDKRHSVSGASPRSSTDESAPSPQKRRSSVAKATAFLASAKQSLHLSSNSHHTEPILTPQQTAMQKLGQTDPALSVPQGSLNNSAGESHPGPRSTFIVGVTEDKNKKCRRTMEDTHAYLYNFLSTPAPVVSSKDADSMRSGASEKKDNAAEKKDGTDSKSDVKSEEASPQISVVSPASAMSEVVETDNGYFAIFDGHAGTFAADWCGKKLHILLEETIRNNPNAAIPELLDQTFTTVDRQLQSLVPLKNSGCTAICAVLRWEDRIPNPQSATGSTAIAPVAAAVAKAGEASPGTTTPAPIANAAAASLPVTVDPSNALPKLQEAATRQRVLYTANVGDARIVLCRNGKALRLSYDHKGSDENEGRRIQNAGGLILNNRVNGVLAVTRALGDAYMKDLVTGHPYTTETVIQPDADEFLILACDGLWDVCSDQDAVDLIRPTQDAQLASKQLVDHALSRFSTDNLSCMVVRFDTEALKRAIATQTDLIGVEGDPSDKKGGLSEADAHVKEARKSLSLPDGTNVHEEISRISQEIIREEEEQEAGPELEPEGVRKLATAHQAKLAGEEEERRKAEEQGDATKPS